MYTERFLYNIYFKIFCTSLIFQEILCMLTDISKYFVLTEKYFILRDFIHVNRYFKGKVTG